MVNLTSFPQELFHKIKHYVTPSSHDLLVVKFNKIKNSSAYEDTKLYFPSTNSFQFVNIKESISTDYEPDPKSIEENSYIVPSIQCGIGERVRISDVLLGNSYSGGLRLAHTIEQLFFDMESGRAAFLAKAPGYVVVGVGDPSNKHGYTVKILRNRNNHRPQSQFISNEFKPQSLCFHATDREEFSIIAVENYDNCVMSIFDLIDVSPQRKFTIPVSLVEAIKKHEYIGKDVFLLLGGVDLFFCKEESGKLIISLQSFFDNELKNAQGRYSIISFCVNQNKRTPAGRARYFFILAELKSQGKNVEQVILSVDLLNHHNTITKIWSLAREEDNKMRFDRISYNEEGFCLWNDNDKDTSAMIIRFQSEWMDMLENADLFKLCYKDSTNSKNNIVLEKTPNEKRMEKKPSQADSIIKPASTALKKNYYNKFKIFLSFLIGGLFIVVNWKKFKKMFQ